MPLLINGQPFTVPQGLEIDESNPYSLTPVSGGLEVNWGDLGIDTIEGQTYLKGSSGLYTLNLNNQFNQPRIIYKAISESGNFSYVTMSNAETCTLSSSFVIGFLPNLYEISCNLCEEYGLTLQILVTDGTYAKDIEGRYLGGSCSNTFTSISPSLQSSVMKITSNTGEISQRETLLEPIVSLLDPRCQLIINYSNGSQSPLMEFPICPTVEIIPDCNCVCPSTLDLADSIISLLGTF